MRLPWPFGRAQRSPSPGDGATAAGSGGPSAPPPERASGTAWRDLPALAETVGPPPLVAPSRPFAAGLASKEPPAPILAPLSHGRSLDAPKGLVSGIARPSVSVAGPPLPAPVQRSPLGGRPAGEHDVVENETGELAAVAGATSAAASAPASASEPRPAAPVRRLEATATAAPMTTLTRAPEPARQAPLVGLVGQPKATGAARAPFAAPAATAAPAPFAAVQRSPGSASASLPALGTPPAPAVQRSPTRPAAAAAPAGSPRLTIGQARRLGLGAPLAGGLVLGSSTAPRAAEPGPQRAPASESTPGVTAPAAAALPARPTRVQRAPETDGADALDMPLAMGGSSPDADPVETAPPASTTGPGVQRAPAQAPVHPRRLAPAIERSPMAAATPILAAQPLRTGLQRAPLTLPQRAPAGRPSSGLSSPATDAAPTSGPGADAPVTVHRDGQASQLASALDARSFTHGGEIYLPSSHGSLTTGTGKALLAHELTHVAQQRRLGSGLPGEQSPHGKSLEAEAVAAEHSGSLPLAMPRSRGQGTDEGSHEEAPGSQRAPQIHQSSSSDTVRVDLGGGVQRAPMTSGAMSVDGNAGRRDGPGEQTEEELEDLAHKLYARIGRRLRRELLVDRERAGMALDLS